MSGASNNHEQTLLCLIHLYSRCLYRVLRCDVMSYSIIQGDAGEQMFAMPEGVVDLTVTSPPYDDLRSYGGHSELDISLIVEGLWRVTKQGGVVIWVIGDKTHNGSESGTSFEHALLFRQHGFRIHDTMIFAKNNPMPSDCGKRYRQTFDYIFCFSKGQPKTFTPLVEPTKSAGKTISAFRATKAGRNDTPAENVDREIKATRKVGNIFYYNVGTSSATDKLAFEHPAIFPEKLAQDQILSWSGPGDLVFDPFCGSGTTGKVAILNGRRFIGVDISEEYCELARRRIQNAVETVSGSGD